MSMMRMRVVTAALVLGLGACGGGDDGGDDGGTVDHRPNVTGAYASTGTMTLVIFGQSQTNDFSDTIRIAASAGSNKSALNLRSDAFECGDGFPGTMTGERAFSVQQTECQVHLDEQDCDGTLTVRSGTGNRDEAGTLHLSMKGDFSSRNCAPIPVTGQFTMGLTGNRTGE
ncbi:hypothetical protein [Myxococcus faecalis]|uniref:hypothetical protein n=1 Tax=Myxococcus faecalis TaxID=3115646 RepID=UPI003CEBEC02